MKLAIRKRPYHRRRAPKQQTCAWCLEQFSSIRDDALCCSPRCRKALSRDPDLSALRRNGRSWMAWKKLLSDHRKFELEQRWRNSKKEIKKHGNEFYFTLYGIKKAKSPDNLPTSANLLTR
jgi:hypothetical protein